MVMRCTECGSVEIVAVKPGSEPVYRAEAIRTPDGGTRTIHVLAVPDEPMRLYCRRHWPSLRSAA